MSRGRGTLEGVNQLLVHPGSGAEGARFVMDEFVNENMNLLVKVGRFEDQSKTALAQAEVTR
jgi:hypothetical protein